MLPMGNVVFLPLLPVRMIIGLSLLRQSRQDHGSN
jgi:hypothetical protein